MQLTTVTAKEKQVKYQEGGPSPNRLRGVKSHPRDGRDKHQAEEADDGQHDEARPRFSGIARSVRRGLVLGPAVVLVDAGHWLIERQGGNDWR